MYCFIDRKFRSFRQTVCIALLARYPDPKHPDPGEYLYCNLDFQPIRLRWYYKLGNFRENFIFANSVKRHICHGKKSRLGHNLNTSVNDRVICHFTRVNFHETSQLRSFCENKTLEKISEFTVFDYGVDRVKTMHLE